MTPSAGVAAVDEPLRARLLALAAEDQRVRAALDAAGELEGGYHPRMAAVHRANAAALRAVLDAHGWPGAPLAGADGAEAAWLVAIHAVGEPAFQRRCLALLEAAAASGAVPAWHPAMLGDRVRMHEGRPQRYGTQLEPDDEGFERVYATEEPDEVEARRAAVGLPPLAERLAQRARLMPAEAVPAWRRGYAAWLRATGWRA